MDEELTGLVVDIACLRKYRRSEVVEKAKEHTRECLLMGHCIESGYGLVTDTGEIRLLDTLATPRIVALVSEDGRDRGNKLKVLRSWDEEGGMQTRDVHFADEASEEQR